MVKEVELTPGRFVGGNRPCFIIAEVGQNHQGDLYIAKRMIQIAKEIGADCVKFQKSDLNRKFNYAALNRYYDSPHSWGTTYGEHKKKLEFSELQYYELAATARAAGIAFTASGMDERSVDFLDALGVPFLKVGSGDTNNFPYLEHTARKGKPMVISSGMQSMATMKKVYNLIKPINPNFCFLQCTSCYPTVPENVNLRVIRSYEREFPDIPIGYSGHELGVTISVGAVGMGAKVHASIYTKKIIYFLAENFGKGWLCCSVDDKIVERHITLDKTWKGSDHACSLDPFEFRNLIDQIRLLEKAFGSPTKKRQSCEMPCYNKLGKSVVASCNIPVGTTILPEMLCIKVAEPKGWDAENMKELIGKTTSSRFIGEDESITENDVCT